MLLSLTAALLCVILAEIGLRILTPFPIHAPYANRLPHATRLYQIDPALPDVDTRGFRNPRAKRDYDIAAIGDSHTYGNNTTWDQAWPYQLGNMTGKSVYNMGTGGYSVPQYYQLCEEALADSPRYVVVGLFVPNDLVGPTFHGACHTAYWKTRAEKLQLVSPMWRHPGLVKPWKDPEYGIFGVSALASALRYATEDGSSFFNQPCFEFSIAGSRKVEQVDRERVRGHARATDTEREEIRNAFLDSITLFRAMNEMCALRNCRLGVLLIPSKEHVLLAWCHKNSISLPKGFAELVGKEVALFRQLEMELHKAGIPYASAVQELVTAHETLIRSGHTLYPIRNTHPRAAGYTAYAKAAVPLVRPEGQ
jgi:hypothetical protein